MTDQKHLTNVLDSLGIRWGIFCKNDRTSVIFGDFYCLSPKEYDSVEIVDGIGHNGYSGFYTEFVFDERGCLIEYGVWE